MKKEILLILSVAIFFIAAFSQKQKETLKVGEKIPELNLNSPEGQPIALSSLKGKIVLVYFWASYNRPGRWENKFVVSAYREFKDKEFQGGNGFTVYAISMDRYAESWKNGIIKDSLNWPSHVSELKEWDSEALKICKVDNFPANFLINGDGIILAIDLRGDELKRKLLEIVKK